MAACVFSSFLILVEADGMLFRGKHLGRASPDTSLMAGYGWVWPKQLVQVGLGMVRSCQVSLGMARHGCATAGIAECGVVVAVSGRVLPALSNALPGMAGHCKAFDINACSHFERLSDCACESLVFMQAGGTQVH